MSVRVERDEPPPSLNDTVVHQSEHFKITIVGAISMALGQLPAIGLGTFGIMKAFMNHGASGRAVVDCLRYNDAGNISADSVSIYSKMFV